MNKEVIVGIDEAGRGALAGPVVVAAFIFNPKDLRNEEIKPLLKDSKALSEKRRELASELLYASHNSMVATKREADYIDCMNILNATKAAATEAFNIINTDYMEYVYAPPGEVNNSWSNSETAIPLDCRDFSQAPLPHIYVDGNVPLVKTKHKQTCVVRGDSSVPEIMAASIIAKTKRDSIMRNISTTLKERFGGKDPYNFAVNKGYGTPEHLEALRLYGPTEFHRTTFRRVKEYVS